MLSRDTRPPLPPMAPPAGTGQCPQERHSSSNAMSEAILNLMAPRRPNSTSHTVPFAPDTSTVTAQATISIPRNGDARRTMDQQGQLEEHDPLRDGATYESDPNLDIAISGGLSVVGGPVELKDVILSLGRDRPLNDRIAAVQNVIAALDKYRVGNLGAVWTAAGDLVHDNTASTEAFKLLISCVKNNNNFSSAERMAFWEAVETCTGNASLEVRFDALEELTNKGRNVEPFETQLPAFLISMLRTCYQAVRENRDKKMSKLLDRLLDFVMKVTQCNARIFQDPELEAICNDMILFCKKSTTMSEIEKSIGVINSLVTYASIPIAAIAPCVGLLADVHRQLVALKKETFTVLRNIFSRSYRQEALDSLVNTLSKASMDFDPAEEQTSAKANPYRGALHLLFKLVRANGKADLPKFPLSVLLPAVACAVRIKNPWLDVDVLSMYSRILEREALRKLLTESDVDWKAMVETILLCSDNLMYSTHPLATTTLPKKYRFDPATNRSVELDWTGGLLSFTNILKTLDELFWSLSLAKRDAVAAMFLQLGERLNNSAAENIVQYCDKTGHLVPAADMWLNTCEKLVVIFLHDRVRPASLRMHLVEVMRKTWAAVVFVRDNETQVEIASLILRDLQQETDPRVLEALAEFAGEVLEGGCPAAFDLVLSLLRDKAFEARRFSQDSQQLQHLKRPLPTPPLSPPGQKPQPSSCRLITKHAIRSFISLVSCSARKSESLFLFILDVASSAVCDTDARICAIKLLSRLRSDSLHRVYIKRTSESEKLAAVLCRTADTLFAHAEDPNMSPREGRNISSGSETSAALRPRIPPNKRVVLPLWFYPGPKALPKDPDEIPSWSVWSSDAFKDLSTPPGEVAILRMTHWLEAVLLILQQPDVDWEIYSYVLVHLGAQLANQSLFALASRQLKLLRNVVCDQLRSSTFREPPSHTSLKKADVAICMFEILTKLVSYHEHFAPVECHDIVRIFTSGMGSWDGTSKWCIHALSVCCHEIPLSVSKSLHLIILKMSQIITQPQIAIHILQFLCSLARLPDLFKNFREEEYKTVFGVSFRYLQYVRDQKEKDSTLQMPTAPKTMMRHSDSFREVKGQAEANARPKARTGSEDLPQYVYALAFHVITFWFMALKLSDRAKLIPFIVKNLKYKDRSGEIVVEDQGLVTMDMLDMYANTDHDVTEYNKDFFSNPKKDGVVSKRTWIVGLSLITIETAGKSGISQIIIRRPSGTRYIKYKPLYVPPPAHQTVPWTMDPEMSVKPEDILQEFYAPIRLACLSIPVPVTIPVSEDDGVIRIINNLDRNPTVDSHKVGVIYVGPGQNEEVEILANDSGSPDFTDFLTKLGTLRALRGAPFDTHGLDRQSDSDGKYTFCWRDRATEMVFHVPTMMPTDAEFDPRCNRKKSHIGNDYVNIIWNDSGRPFEDFNTFPSQVTLTYIVITPLPGIESTTAAIPAPVPSMPGVGGPPSSSSAGPSPALRPISNTSTGTMTNTPPSSTAHLSADLHASAPSPTPSLTPTTGSSSTTAQTGSGGAGPSSKHLSPVYLISVLSASNFPAISPASDAKVVTRSALAPFVRLLALNASFLSLVWATRADGDEGAGEHFSNWRNRLRGIRQLKKRVEASAAAAEAAAGKEAEGGVVRAMVGRSGRGSLAFPSSTGGD